MTEEEEDVRLSAFEKVIPYHCLMNPQVELFALFEAFDRTSKTSILEIGTFKGATSAAFALAFPQARVTTIDLPDPRQTVWNPQDGAQTAVALREIGVQGVEEVRMSSSNLGEWVKVGRRFDMVFVDGDHSTEQVVSDALHALDLLTPGGSVVLHDYTDPQDDSRPCWTLLVYAAVEEVLRRLPGVVRKRLPGWLVELRWRDEQSRRLDPVS